MGRLQISSMVRSMKIVNNRVVCSGCEEPFEVGQKMRAFVREPLSEKLIGEESGR